MTSNVKIKFSLSLVAVIVLIAVVLGVVAGRAAGGTSSSTGGGSGGAAAGKKVDVIIKASDSSFWQTMLAGAKKAGADYGIKVGLFGPTSETDVNQQVQLVENSISRGVDAIVLASNSSDACADAAPVPRTRSTAPASTVSAARATTSLTPPQLRRRTWTWSRGSARTLAVRPGGGDAGTARSATAVSPRWYVEQPGQPLSGQPPTSGS